MIAHDPADEAGRLAAPARYQILDTAPEPTFDTLTRLAAQICHAPMALVSLVDGNRQWFKSRVGCDLEETPRNIAFCACAISQDDILVVPDTLADTRFAANPLVAGPPHIRFYAGVPLMTEEGHALGTLCILDQVPRKLDAQQITTLRALAKEAMTQLDLRRKNLELQPIQDRLQLITDAVPALISYVDAQRRYRFINKAYEAWFGCPRDELLGKHLLEVLGEAAYDRISPHVERVLAGECVNFEAQIPYRHGETRYISASCIPDYGADDGTRREVKGYVGLITDITERRRTELALRRSEARKAAMLATALDCVIGMDHRGNITEFNSAAEAVFGYQRTEVLGKEMAEILIPPHLREAHRKGLAHYLWTGEAPVLGKRIEMSAMRADGKEFPIELAVARIPVDGPPEFTAYLRDITERKRTEERLSYLASYDALTNLPNRVLFTDRLRQALAQSPRHQRLVAVLFLDVDRFKHINDTLGHDIGDLLLQAVAGRLLNCVRETDTVARLSGDEFVLMLTDIARPADATQIAQKLLDALRQPFEVGSHTLFVEASIGISLYPKDGADVKTLLKNADTAMYQAKERGRNQYRQYSPAMGARAARRRTLEYELRGALAKNEFELEYQPQIDLGSGRITAAEAFLRWRRPGRERLVPSSEFIREAEAQGLLGPISEWVLRAACSQSLAWQTKGLPSVSASVNLEAAQFQYLNLGKTIERILKETTLDPSGLEIELNERLLRTPATEKLLLALKNLGVGIVIDEFGTGYSSLSYLKRFSIDRLKVDRSFMRAVPGDTHNEAIITAMIAMAHSLKIKITVEGVETAEQLQFLRALGCDGVQGYLLGRPLSAEALTRMLLAETVSGTPVSAG